VLLAHATGTAPSEGTTTLVLRLASKYIKDLKHFGKLRASITVRFVPPPPAEELSAEATATLGATVAKKSGRGAGRKK
jgi:hypothetical protein